MKKDREIKIITIISAVISAFVSIIGCMCVVFPKLAFSLYDIIAGLPGDMEQVLSAKAVPFMVIRTLLPLIFTIIAVVNVFSGEYSQTKGIATISVTVIAQIIVNLATNWLYSMAMQISTMDGMNMVTSLSLMNISIVWINMLNFFAVMMLISVASVEIYASEKYKKE